MKFVYLLVVLITMSSCVKDSTSVHEKNMPVISKDSNKDSAINREFTPTTEHNVFQDSPEYVAKNEVELSVNDSETAYEMCVKALTDYYKAVWNGSDIELDTFIENEYLKQYMQKKIHSQYAVYGKFNDKVLSIEISDWEVEYTGMEVFSI